MRRLDVDYREAALADLRQIYLWIYDASQSPVIAKGFADRIVASCEKLGDMPFGGRARPDLGPGLRSVAMERRVVIVYGAGERVEIVRVFYGGRDYETLFGETSDG